MPVCLSSLDFSLFKLPGITRLAVSFLRKKFINKSTAAAQHRSVRGGNGFVFMVCRDHVVYGLRERVQAQGLTLGQPEVVLSPVPLASLPRAGFNGQF